MRNRGKAKTRGNTYERPNAGSTIKRGSFFLPGLGETDVAVSDRVNSLLGGKYAVDREAPFWIAAITDLLA